MKRLILSLIFVSICPKMYTMNDNLVGNFDPTFGSGTGRVTVDFSGSLDQAFAGVLQEDGKIVVVGQTVGENIDGDPVFVAGVTRLLSNGQRDNTFGAGANGLVTVNQLKQARGVVMQTDGKIIVGGTLDGSFALVRLLSNGQVDTSFSATLVNLSLGSDDQTLSIELQADGKILVAGRSGDMLVVARFTQAGSVDLSFGPDGTGSFVLEEPGTLSFATSLAVQLDGKIIVGAVLQNPIASPEDFLIVRLTENGCFDSSFGPETSPGMVTVDFGGVDKLNSIIVQADGSILAGGRTGSASMFDFAFVRVLLNGDLDPTFGTGGLATLSFSPSQNEIMSMKLDLDGQIVAGGFANTNGHDDFVLMRMNSDGSLDTTFGENGFVTFDFNETSTNDRAHAILIQPDGRITMIGTCNFSQINSLTDGISLLDDFGVSRHIIAPLRITKEASVKHPCPGQNITYKITVRNRGFGTVRDITVTDVLPEDLVFRFAHVSSGTFDPEIRVWSIPRLCAFKKATLKLKARVGQCAGNQVICNTARARFRSMDGITDASIFEELSQLELPVVAATACISTLPVIYENLNNIAQRTDCGLDALTLDIHELKDDFSTERESGALTTVAMNQKLDVLLAKINCMLQALSMTDCVL